MISLASAPIAARAPRARASASSEYRKAQRLGRGASTLDRDPSGWSSPARRPSPVAERASKAAAEPVGRLCGIGPPTSGQDERDPEGAMVAHDQWPRCAAADGRARAEQLPQQTSRALSPSKGPSANPRTGASSFAGSRAPCTSSAARASDPTLRAGDARFNRSWAKSSAARSGPNRPISKSATSRPIVANCARPCRTAPQVRTIPLSLFLSVDSAPFDPPPPCRLRAEDRLESRGVRTSRAHDRERRIGLRWT